MISLKSSTVSLHCSSHCLFALLFLEFFLTTDKTSQPIWPFGFNKSTFGLGNTVEKTYSHNSVVVWECLCGINRPHVWCCCSGTSCNTLTLSHTGTLSKPWRAVEFKNVGDLRKLLMTVRWWACSFRYSALKPSNDTRMRGGLEKLGGKTGRKSDALTSHWGGFVNEDCINYSAGDMAIFGTSSAEAVLYSRFV